MCIDYFVAYTIAGSRHAPSYSIRCLKDVCTHFARCEQIMLRVSVYIYWATIEAGAKSIRKHAVTDNRLLPCLPHDAIYYRISDIRCSCFTNALQLTTMGDGLFTFVCLYVLVYITNKHLWVQCGYNRCARRVWLRRSLSSMLDTNNAISAMIW